MSGKPFLAASAALLAAFAVSCVNISYDGDAKSPKAKRSEVQVFTERSKIPEKNYKTLGTVTASAPERYSASDVERELVDFAKAKGADAVLILSVDRTYGGTARPDQTLSSVGMKAVPVPEETSKVSIKALLLEYPKKDEDDEARNAKEQTDAILKAAGIRVNPLLENSDAAKDKAPRKIEPIPID
jgi:hypothetical protein